MQPNAASPDAATGEPNGKRAAAARAAARQFSTGRRFGSSESGHFPALARQLTSSAGRTRVSATVEGLLRHCAATTSTCFLACMQFVVARLCAQTSVPVPTASAATQYAPRGVAQRKGRCHVYFIAVRVAGRVAGRVWFELTPPRLSLIVGASFSCRSFWVWLTLRYIPNNCVGVVEKLWSPAARCREGRIIALDGEAGYQAELLRGGMHFGFWRWQYGVHKVRLVTIPQGKIGYVYARDGEPLPPSQTLGPRRSSATTFRTPARSWQRRRRRPRARPARPAAGDPARRRVRHQPGAVRRDHRGPRSTRCRRLVDRGRS